MVLVGGAAAAAGFWTFALGPAWWGFVPAIAACGTGFYMLHNTLQTNATQMAPHARGLAVSVFAACLFLGQAVGVDLCGRIIDATGYEPVFAATGTLLLALAVAFGASLPRRL
jgi:predicted MFS family arabinose efflux permease